MIWPFAIPVLVIGAVGVFLAVRWLATCKREAFFRAVTIGVVLFVGIFGVRFTRSQTHVMPHPAPHPRMQVSDARIREQLARDDERLRQQLQADDAKLRLELQRQDEITRRELQRHDEETRRELQQEAENERRERERDNAVVKGTAEVAENADETEALQDQLNKMQLAQQIPVELPPAVPPPSAAPAGEQPLEVMNHSYFYGASKPQTIQSVGVPQWVTADQQNRPHGEAQRNFVISSQRFATADEARQQLLPQIRDRLQKEFHFAGMPARGLTVQQLLGTVVQQEAVVTWPLEVGGFQEKVYQVHWQVSLNDGIRREFELASRDENVRKRLTMLGLAAGGLTVAFAAMGRVLRRKNPAGPVA